MEYDIKTYLNLFKYEIENIERRTKNLKFNCFNQLLDEVKPIKDDLNNVILNFNNHNTNLWYIKQFNYDFINSINELEINQYTDDIYIIGVWYNLKRLNNELDSLINLLLIKTGAV